MKIDDIAGEIMQMVRNVTEKPSLVLTTENKFTDIKDWDSLNTVDLEMDIEAQLDIEFETGEFQTYETIDELIEAVKLKLSSL